MEMKDFEQMIKLLSKTLELKHKLDAEREKNESDEDDDDDDDDENEGEAKLCQELSDEHQSIMRWCFGNKFESLTRVEAQEKWKKRHPDLPMPRSLLTSHLHSLVHNAALYIDVIPLYHAHKKED